MNREQKAKQIENLKESFVASKLTVLADYKGLNSNQANDLRAVLRKEGASFQVVKNRLAKLAIQDTPLTFLNDHLKETTAIATTKEDVVGLAKALFEFSKENEKLSLRVASMDEKELAKADIEALSKLPSREELIGKLMGSMQAPAQNLVLVLAQLPKQIVNVLAQIRDQKEG